MAIVAEVAGQGFSYVAFEINGVLRSIATAAPYSYILNTEGCESGSYTVRVSAYDVMGTPLATTEQQFMVSHDAAPAR